MLLAGCARSDRTLEAPAPPPPNLPAVPADVLACPRDATDPPDRDLDAGEVERLWKTDRAALAKVSGCLRRLICQDLETRRELGKVDEKVCTPAAAKKPARRLFRSKLGRER
ncbi:hypothetical protein [Rhodopseudomonas sp. RCAM05734]|uniref:hypothetical protein n=1 Tax=Rhodopseudomonas sp. RCAM05734 TaxID=3457549 RepID=UPI004044D7E2